MSKAAAVEDGAQQIVRLGGLVRSQREEGADWLDFGDHRFVALVGLAPAPCRVNPRLADKRTGGENKWPLIGVDDNSKAEAEKRALSRCLATYNGDAGVCNHVVSIDVDSYGSPSSATGAGGDPPKEPIVVPNNSPREINFESDEARRRRLETEEARRLGAEDAIRQQRLAEQERINALEREQARRQQQEKIAAALAPPPPVRAVSARPQGVQATASGQAAASLGAKSALAQMQERLSRLFSVPLPPELTTGDSEIDAALQRLNQAMEPANIVFKGGFLDIRIGNYFYSTDILKEVTRVLDLISPSGRQQ